MNKTLPSASEKKWGRYHNSDMKLKEKTLVGGLNPRMFYYLISFEMYYLFHANKILYKGNRSIDLFKKDYWIKYKLPIFILSEEEG